MAVGVKWLRLKNKEFWIFSDSSTILHRFLYIRWANIVNKCGPHKGDVQIIKMEI